MSGKRANHSKKTPKSEILKYIINSLHTGEHSHMLYFVNNAEDIFEIKFVNRRSSQWKEKDISLFRALDALFGRFEREPNYETQCKVRARANLSGLCKRGLLEYRGILQDKATKIRRYRILKRVEGSINSKTMKKVSPSTTSGSLSLNVVRTAKSSLQQPVGHPCVYIYQAESEMQKSESQSSEITENFSLQYPQMACASSPSGSGIPTSLVSDHTREAPNYSLESSQMAWDTSPFRSEIVTFLVPDHTRKAPNYSLEFSQMAWDTSPFRSEIVTSLVPDHTREAANYSLESSKTAWDTSPFRSEIVTFLVPDHTREAPKYLLGSSQTAWGSSPSRSDILTSLVSDQTREAFNNSLGCAQTDLASSPSGSEFLQQNTDFDQFLPSPLADGTREAFNISPLPDLEDFGELEIPRLSEFISETEFLEHPQQ